MIFCICIKGMFIQVLKHVSLQPSQLTPCYSAVCFIEEVQNITKWEKAQNISNKCVIL